MLNGNRPQFCVNKIIIQPETFKIKTMVVLKKYGLASAKSNILSFKWRNYKDGNQENTLKMDKAERISTKDILKMYESVMPILNKFSFRMSTRKVKKEKSLSN